MQVKSKLIDKHGRVVDYLRLAVTDRCNLRCFYCMPESGIKFVPRADLLSYEEMLRLSKVLAGMGVEKIRITGGEPFLRKGLTEFLYKLADIEGINKIRITTNGTLTKPFIPDLIKTGIRSVNLSLDTLDRERFLQITRRDAFEEVWDTMNSFLDAGIHVKINMVVMNGINDQDILPMVELASRFPVDVRFIEEMPFNGDTRQPQLEWNYQRIAELIRSQHQEIVALPFQAGSTTYDYEIPGFKGKIGIIAAYSRTFCGSCNRLRITPKGMLKTCLYDDGVFDLKQILRHGADDTQLEMAIREAVGQKARDGFEAEQRKQFLPFGNESMASIGG
jgi:molybdenum cofactor biosynthesis protein A